MKKAITYIFIGILFILTLIVNGFSLTNILFFGLGGLALILQGFKEYKIHKSNVSKS